MNPLKVGIVGLKCLDHLTGEEIPRYLGGIETQLATLAKGLVAQGCEVTVITYDHGQSDDLDVDGVRVFKCHRPDAGIRVLRTLHPRTTGQWQAMRRADAHIWLQMGAGIETGQVALICKSIKRPFVYCIASDGDTGEFFNSGLEGKTYRWGLQRATRIIAQTQKQQLALKASSGLDSTIIPMAVVPPYGNHESNQHPHVLWVGRIMPTKRLEWLIEAAKLTPEVIFDVVGTPNGNSEYANQLMDEARLQSNLVVHGRAPASTLAKLYGGASLLACTSELEGFPTTFLEAWSHGLPVVTTFDPDGVVATHGLGEVAENLNEFVEKLTGLLTHPNKREVRSRAATNYYKSNHSVDQVSRRFIQMLKNTAEG